jgi:type IV secretion system protein VirB8
MASGVSSGDLKRYFEEARSWDYNRAKKAVAERRLAYGVAAASTAVALATLAWHVAAPLKSVEPYVIRVNQSSGSVDVISVVKRTKEITADEAVSKYFLSEYVRNRESWVASASNELFKAVAVASTSSEQQKLVAERRAENPSSPAIIYRNGETVGVRVTKVTFINDRVAQLYFTKIVQQPGGINDAKSNWVATINFRYVEKPETEADRLYNPLGFQVVSYRADPEVAP